MKVYRRKKMKNKMFLIVGVIVLLFVGLLVMTNMKNKQAINDESNPYDKDELRQETIDLLGDENYQNIIVPTDLDKKLADKETVTVYYFSPTCSYCQEATPILSPIADELDADVKKMNLLEYDLMDHYGIEGTPTLIHYENGEEVKRIAGFPDEPEKTYRAFLEEYAVK